MKRHFHFHFYIRLFVLVIVGLIFSLFIYNQVIKAEEGDVYTDIRGWAWSPNIGWVSLNCYNDFNNDGELTAADNYCFSERDGYTGLGSVDYGLKLKVTIADDRSIDNDLPEGCAWAGEVGWWICFDDPGGTQAPANGIYLNDYYEFAWGLPPVPSPSLVYNSLCHSDLATCHASIVPLEDEPNWTHELGFPIMNEPEAVTDMDGCFNCEEITEFRCDGDLAKVICSEGDDASCKLLYDPDTSTCNLTDNAACDNCLEYTYDEDTSEMIGVVGGYDCSDCALDSPDARCTDSAYDTNANACQSCSKYYTTPGVIMDYATTTNDGDGYMCGWAWNQDPVSLNGIGWLQFSPRITSLNNPYFSVDTGNIYSRGSIRANYAPPLNVYNAYIIEAGGSIHQLAASSTLALQNRSLIDFPAIGDGTGQYANILGKIDFDGLITEVGVTGKNKYGSSIIDYDDEPEPEEWATVLSGGSLLLDNKVLYKNNAGITGEWDTPLIIKAGKLPGEDGSGIIIFGGGPTGPSSKILYDDTNFSSIDHIPSVVWIIKGDFLVNTNEVAEIAGTFIILGADGSDCETELNNCGQFRVLGNNQLTINGSVLAKRFQLDSTYAVGGEPAEKFINDGRLQINPPAGLQNFVRSLPKFNYDPQ